MKSFELVTFAFLMTFLPHSCETLDKMEQGGKKQLIVYHPKPHRNGAFVLYGNEGSGQDEGVKDQLNALSNSVESVTNLVKAQSEIIENLSHQVASVVKGTGNDKELKKALAKIANNTEKIHNVTKKQNKAIKQINELAGAWSATTVDLNKRVKTLEERTEETEGDIEDAEKTMMQKIEKLQAEVKSLRLAMKYTTEQISARKQEWPSGKYCILASGRCPEGFTRHHGHLKSLYLYSSHSQFVNEAKFGSSSIGCFGSFCGQYGNFIGSITIVTCCK